MTERFTVSVPGAEGWEERFVYIYLPDSYFRQQERRYPVLYMFDGHNVFFDEDATYGRSWRMERYMERSHTQMMIAAVECSHDPNHGRLKEYAPFSFQNQEVGRIEGMGQRTMDWFAYELKPSVDENFRTLPDRGHTFIAGSSMGGLMSLYALMQYNHIYSKAAALSPSLWTNPRQAKNMIAHADLDRRTVLYMDYGAGEFQNHSGQRRLFGEVSSLLIQKGVLLNSRIVPDGQHTESSWERQIPFFMKTLQYRG